LGSTEPLLHSKPLIPAKTKKRRQVRITTVPILFFLNFSKHATIIKLIYETPKVELRAFVIKLSIKSYQVISSKRGGGKKILLKLLY